MDQVRHEAPASEQDAAEFFTCMAEKVRDYAIFIMDSSGTIRTWNKAAEVMKGYTAEEAIGSFVGLLYTEEERDHKRPQHNLDMAVKNGTYQEETWRRKKDGSLFWAMVEIIAIKKENGELKGFCKITRDISVRKALADKLAAEKERAQVTLAAIGEAVISIDTDGKVDYLNPKAEQMTGWPSQAALGRPFSEIFRVVDEVTGESQEQQLITWLKQGSVPENNSSAVLISRDGSQYAIEDTAAPICLPNGCIAGGVIVFRDVTESRELFRATTYHATHDALTGLVNRTEFENRLQRSLDHVLHGHSPGALLYMDLDQFKVVNDVCGHHAGDELLKQIARLYRGEIRERDTLARLGGDEFSLIAEHCSMEEAHAIARKILQSTRDFQFVCKDRVFKIGVSIGLVTFDDTIRNTKELVKTADRACYIAKEKGRNQVVFLEPEDSATVQSISDIDWPRRLSEAMRQNQLSLHYQTIADANGGQGIRYEVLLRLNDPTEGVILPERFLPAAERYALMPEIDRWVVRQVLQWLTKNRRHAGMLELCAINLSNATVMDESFPGYLVTLLKQHRVAAAKLCFEITETAIMADIQRGLSFVDELRNIGCKVCLVDFGKGLGSFAHLKRLPVDFVKIGTSSVSEVSQSMVDQEVVKSLNNLAHLLGKKTIAQCVEDQETMDILSHIGIDYVQGNWIAHPKEIAGSFC
jgi:diguanylate cyclase (GGDEF)-like protein/PAS domain S-box-containing protein